MDQFFNRLEDLIQTLLGENRSSRRSSPRFDDPDMAAAWDELDEFLGGASTEPREGTGGTRGPGGGTRAARPDPRESLRDDYRNLEVSFGAPLAEVRAAYRRLIMTYHPDKYADDPGKAKVATEIASRLNDSFNRIKAYEQRDRR